MISGLTLSPLPCCSLFGFLDCSEQVRLLPVRGAASPDPAMRRSDRASKNLREASGAEFQGILPGHAPMLPEKKKCAMRKMILARLYALRNM